LFPDYPVVDMSGTFRDLESWQKAFDLTLSVYSVTRTFPKEEVYGLTIQLRRAAVSVVSNIAEGKGRSSDKELLQFLAIAKGSLFEVETQLELAQHLSYLSASQAQNLASKVNETGRLLNGLMRAFRPLAQMPVTRIPRPEA
jgi:four helix bundle protein